MVNTRKHLKNRYIGGTEYHVWILYRFGFIDRYAVTEENNDKACFIGDLQLCEKYLDHLEEKYILEKYGF